MNNIFMVTGAASGIGQALTQRLLKDGKKVCACDIDFARLESTYAAYSADQLLLQKLDVRQSQNWNSVVEQVLQKWQKIDVLCNVAGVLKENWVMDSSANEVDLHFDINVKGTIFGTQSVLPSMRAQSAGHIINMASLAALSPVPGLSLYSASKFAVRSYSISAGMELAEYGIAVTAICPDAVQTPMLDQQKGKVQAALTFSGSRSLTTDEVVNAIYTALKNKPLEMVLPPMRGLIAKLSNAFPEIAAGQVGRFRKKGMKRQTKVD